MNAHSSPAGATSHTKVALVTGASSGIGRAIAARLLAGGYTTYAAARRLDAMESLGHDGARLIPLDVTDESSRVAAMRRIQEETGRLDALVNNAGYGAYGALEDVPLDEARRQFDVNVFGLARLIQLALPVMRGQGGGRIVNVSSIGGEIHEPMGSWYHATKFAVEGLSDCLRMELAPFGIDVVVIQPGAIRTEWSGIARRSLLETSGATAYARQAALAAALLESADRQNGSPPEAVADVVWKALAAPRPRTRYRVGGGAKLLTGLRWLLSDRAFDSVIRQAAAQTARIRARPLSLRKRESHGERGARSVAFRFPALPVSVPAELAFLAGVVPLHLPIRHRLDQDVRRKPGGEREGVEEEGKDGDERDPAPLEKVPGHLRPGEDHDPHDHGQKDQPAQHVVEHDPAQEEVLLSPVRPQPALRALGPQLEPRLQKPRPAAVRAAQREAARVQAQRPLYAQLLRIGPAALRLAHRFILRPELTFPRGMKAGPVHRKS